MRKIILLGYLMIFATLFAQENANNPSFSILKFGAYGGISFSETSKIGGSFLIEGKSNITSNLNLGIALGYSKINIFENYEVKANSKVTTNNIIYYQSVMFDVIGKEYDILQLLLGTQYIYRNKTISPYFQLYTGYNYISTKVIRTGGYVKNYLSYDEIPEEFKKPQQNKATPPNSFSFNIGFGSLYHISNKLSLDLKYLFKYDTEIVNSHQILLGLLF